MIAAPLIRDTTPGIHQVCETANTDYAITIPDGAMGCVLWFETSIIDPTRIGGGLDLTRPSTRSWS